MMFSLSNCLAYKDGNLLFNSLDSLIFSQNFWDRTKSRLWVLAETSKINIFQSKTGEKLSQISLVNKIL